MYNSWEYPNDVGAGCNVKSPQDSDNLLSFLQELRAAGPNLTLSAATQIFTPLDANTQRMTNVSGFAQVLDYVEIMNYDVWGSWSSSVGPNSPLNDTCAPKNDQQGSAVAGLQNWVNAGMPANQIVLGVASYGHSTFVSSANATAGIGSGVDSTASNTRPSGTTPITLYAGFDSTRSTLGDSWDSLPASTKPVLDDCGQLVTPAPDGIFNFVGMVEMGILDNNGTVKPGFGFVYDDCSQTVRFCSLIVRELVLTLLLQPFVYVAENNTMISYDDPTSFAAKGKFIAEQGLRGFAMWEAAGDYNDLLVDSILSAIGVDEVGC